MHCIEIIKGTYNNKGAHSNPSDRIARANINDDSKKLAVPVAHEFLSQGSWPALSSAAQAAITFLGFINVRLIELKTK